MLRLYFLEEIQYLPMIDPIQFQENNVIALIIGSKVLE